MENYRVLEVIGEGTYGKVFKAQERETGILVAIKRFKQSEDEDSHATKTMNREIKVLRDYKMSNIVNLRSVFHSDNKLHLVFDYEERNLLEELQQARNNALDADSRKYFVYQILKATEHMHDRNLMHRDIKPENILISKNRIVKLCDFGFARGVKADKKFIYTDYVSTRWYRAPELLVGDA